MRLNAIKPAKGAKAARKRVGRGSGSGLGKTCGRGQNGQKSRSGGYHKVGFEGGQMPLQRRLPKRGFNSPREGETAQVRLSALNKIDAEVVDLDVLKKARIIPRRVKRAKVILSGELKKAVSLRGIAATRGAMEAIGKAGGKVED